MHFTAEALTAATPVEVDTRLAALGDQAAHNAVQTAAVIDRMHYALGERKVWINRSRQAWPTRADEAIAAVRANAANGTPENPSSSFTWAGLTADFDRLGAELDIVTDEIRVLHDEYVRRGRWTRAFIVTNVNGHVHRDRGCSTCYPTTDFDWLPEQSGKDEAAIIEAAGCIACTVCYPNAPVEALRRPTSIFSRQQLADAATRAAKDAEKAARAAALAEKAIANPDGTPLRLRGLGVIATERAAQIRYVDDAAYVAACDAGYPYTGRVDESRVNVEKIRAALAHKRGVTETELIESLAGKVAARVRRDYP